MFLDLEMPSHHSGSLCVGGHEHAAVMPVGLPRDAVLAALGTGGLVTIAPVHVPVVRVGQLRAPPLLLPVAPVLVLHVLEKRLPQPLVLRVVRVVVLYALLLDVDHSQRPVHALVARDDHLVQVEDVQLRRLRPPPHRTVLVRVARMDVPVEVVLVEGKQREKERRTVFP